MLGNPLLSSLRRSLLTQSNTTQQYFQTFILGLTLLSDYATVFKLHKFAISLQCLYFIILCSGSSWNKRRILCTCLL